MANYGTTMSNLIQVLKGGPGSGDWGHVGRAGKRGGSGGGGGKGKSSSGKVTDNVKNDKDPNRKSLVDFQNESLSDGLIFPYEVSKKISNAAGVSEKLVEDFIRGWNFGDNFDKFAVVNAINKELGIEFSSYQKENVNKWVAGAANKGLMEPEILSSHKKIVRAVYDETQRQLKDLGITEIVIHRGIITDVSNVSEKDIVEWNGNSVDSWSANRLVALGFSENFKRPDADGMVIRSSIPASRIFSMSSSGPGTSPEEELLVLGNGPDKVFISDIISR